MEMYTSEDEELMINGQRFSDFLSTMELKMMDMEYQLNNQQMRIDTLESENTMIDSQLNEQKAINNDFRDFITYLMDAEMFYRMAMNFTKKMSSPYNPVNGLSLINNASMVATTVSNSVNYGDDAFCIEYWSLIFERAIEIGIEENLLNTQVKDFYSKNLARNSQHTLHGYDIHKERPKFSSLLEKRYNYYDICKLFTGINSDDTCMAMMIIQSLRPKYKVEYINYIFKQWSPTTVVKHWQYIRSCECSSLRDAYFSNMYKVLSSKSGEHYEAFSKDARLIESLRNESSRIDNYFKLRNK